MSLNVLDNFDTSQFSVENSLYDVLDKISIRFINQLLFKSTL